MDRESTWGRNNGVLQFAYSGAYECSAMMTDDLATKNVLVVEDDQRNAALITAMLKIAGVPNSWVCRDGSEIMNTAARMATIDLVLLDLRLPQEDGFQILARLRREPGFYGVPIIATTAQVMPEDLDHAESAGFDGFLGKPLNFDRFPDQIRRIFSGERVWEVR